jgi:phytoene dehydrogenase-like protein
VHDVVVVGGGHNGLVAGCFLARGGLRVLVLEANDDLGGMTLSLPLVPAAPGHLISPCAYENVYLRAGGIVEELGLRAHGYSEHDSAGWAWLSDDGGSIRFQRDVVATAAEISRFSAADGRAYTELMTVALKVMALQDAYGAGSPTRPSPRLLARAGRTLASDRRVRAGLAAMVTGTAADVIAATFESDAVRGAFASIATILGSPTVDGSGVAVLGPATLHHKGAARPVGGMGGLVTALAACLRAHGGETRTGARVARVLQEGGRAAGVELGSGEEVPAAIGVVTAIPPQRVPDLAEEHLGRTISARLRAAPANAAGVATFTVNLALSGRLELPKHARDDADLRKPALFNGAFDQVLDACAQAERGELPQRPPFWAAIFTAVDPTQAPEGQDVVQTYCPVPVVPAGGWEAQRQTATERLLDSAETALPDLRRLEIGRLVESPEDLSERTGTLNGCLYHVDHLPTRLGPLRPALGAGGYRTPLEGLWLTGAGAHPSGGVSGLPGKHAAAALLRSLGRG